MTNQNTVYQLLFETTLFCDLFVMDQFAATNFHDQDKNTVHGTLMVWSAERNIHDEVVLPTFMKNSCSRVQVDLQ